MYDEFIVSRAEEIYYVMFQCKTTPDDAHEESETNFQSVIRHFGMLNDSQQWMFHQFVN